MQTPGEFTEPNGRDHLAAVWDREAAEITARYLSEVPDADALAAEVNTVMIRAFGALSDALNEYFATNRLTRSRYNVLRFLYHAESKSVKMSEISAGIRVSKTAMTSLINALERLGLVCRTLKEADRRSVYITLTPEGERCVRRLLPSYMQRVREIWAPLSDDEKRQLISSLGHLRSHLHGER